MRAVEKEPYIPSIIDTQAEHQSEAPAPMPFETNSNHSTNNHTRENPSTNFQRIRQWVQLVEFFRAPSTPSVEENHFSSTAAPAQQRASGAEHWGPVWQRLPVVEPSESASVMGVIHPVHGLGIHSPTSQRNHPLAPRVQTIPLPQVPEDTEARLSMTTTASPALSIQDRPIGRPSIVRSASDRPGGGSARSPPHRLGAVQLSAAAMSRPEETTGQHPVLAVELRHHGSARPVVNPVLCDMPPYIGHCWGAYDDEDRSVMRGLSIHFPQSTMPATNPPLKQMRLARPRGGILVVRATVENQFVSVVDVQRTVIAWMRWEQPHAQYEGLRLTGRAMARARNGMTKEVDVWVWRGLTRGDSETDVWKINL